MALRLLAGFETASEIHDGAERLGLGVLGRGGGLAGRTVEDDGGLEHGPVAEADEPRALQPDRARAVRLVAVDRDRQPAEPNGLLGGRRGPLAATRLRALNAPDLRLYSNESCALMNRGSTLHFESVPLDDATFPCRLGSTRIALDTAAP